MANSSPEAGERRRLGRLGSQHARSSSMQPLAPIAAGEDAATHPMFSDADLGLGGKTSNIEIRQSFVIGRPPQGMAVSGGRRARRPLHAGGCSPARTATDGRARSPSDWVRLQPPSTGSTYHPDDATQRGMILGAGRDRLSASRANAELEYTLTAEQSGARDAGRHHGPHAVARTAGTIRASAIVNDLAAVDRHVCASSRAAAGGIAGCAG